MNRKIASIAFSILFIAILFQPLTIFSTIPKAEATSLTRLHTHNNKIYNTLEEQVTLQGFSMADLLTQTGWNDGIAKLDHAQELAGGNLTFIECYINYDYSLASVTSAVDELEAWCVANNVYFDVKLDNDGDIAPFLAAPNLMITWFTYWITRYSGVPNFVGCNLFNEPAYTTSNISIIKTVYDALVAVDSTILVFVPSGNYNIVWNQWASNPLGSQAVYTWDFYYCNLMLEDGVYPTTSENYAWYVQPYLDGDNATGKDRLYDALDAGCTPYYSNIATLNTEFSFGVALPTAKNWSDPVQAMKDWLDYNILHEMGWSFYWWSSAYRGLTTGWAVLNTYGVVWASKLGASVLSPPAEEEYMTGSVVDYDLSDVESVRWSSQRKTFYALGRNWVFYFKTVNTVINVVYRSSPDGVTWSSQQVAVYDIVGGGVGAVDIETLDVYNNGSSEVGLAYINYFGAHLMFKNGTLDSSGFISWANETVIAELGGAEVNYSKDVSLSKSYTGVWWVAASTTRYGFSTTYDYLIYSSPDGEEWTLRYNAADDNGDPIYGLYVTSVILPTVDSQDVYFIYADYFGECLWWLKWTGSMTARQQHNFDHQFTDNVVKRDQFSAVIDSDNLMHIVWQDNASNIYYVNWDGTNWGNEYGLTTTAANYPTITWYSTTDNLMVFYNRSNIIYERLYISSWSAELTPYGTSFSAPTYVTSARVSSVGEVPVVWRENNGTGKYKIMFGGAGGVVPQGISMTVTNMDAVDWLFAETKYYRFNATYQMYEGGWSSIVDASLKFSDGIHTISVNYNTVREEFSILSGSDQIVLKDGAVANSSASTVSIIFELYLRDMILDCYDVDVSLKAETEDKSSGWVVIAADYFNIYNLGGRAQYNSVGGGAFHITNGEVFDLEVTPATGDIAANWTWRNLQHLRIIPQISLPSANIGSAYAGEWSAYYGFIYCYEDANNVSHWVDGWNCKIEFSNGFTSPTDFWVNVHIRWYRDGVQMSNSTYFYSFWNVEPDSGTRVIVDLWFNSLNASTTEGGRVSCEYYGMQNVAGSWWDYIRHWLGYEDWTPMLSNVTQSNYRGDLLGVDDEIISTQQISLVKAWCKLEKTSSTGSYSVALEDYEAMEKLFSPQGSIFYGIDPPNVIPPQIVGGLSGGIFQEISRGFGNLIKALTPSLLGGWLLFSGFMDTLFTFAGWRNGFSTISGWIGSSKDLMVSSIGYALQLLTMIIPLITSTMSLFIANVANALTGFLGVFTAVNQVITIAGDTLTPFTDVILALLPLTGLVIVLWILSARDIEGSVDRLKMVVGIITGVAGFFLRIGEFALNLIFKIIDTVKP